MILKGSIVTGTITESDAKGATVALVDGVEGYIRVADISRDRIEDASTVLKAGESVEAKYVGVDRKNRVISLSIKAKDEAEEKEAMDTLKTQEKESMGNAFADAFNAAKSK